MPDVSLPYESLSFRCLDTPQGTPFEIPIDAFIQDVIPPLSTDLKVSEVVSKLKRTGKKSSSQKPITLRDRWRGFPTDPSSFGKPEETSFRPLEGVFNSVLKASTSTARGKHPRLQFQNNAACIMTFLDRESDTLPDAFWTLGWPASWCTIAVCGEYKKRKNNKNEHDNAMKVTSSMNCMLSDPRRRFTYGFTIEDTSMKLWFCDRAKLLCSTPFNFVTDRQYLVHFCLAVAYAEPDQLGWDPTMAQTDQPGQYDITVYSSDGQTRLYCTVQLIADSGSRALLGRGTRVWKIVRIENGKQCSEPMILKDTWVDPERRREGSTLEELLKAARSPDLQDSLDRSFLSKDWDGDVFQDSACTVLDCTSPFPSKVRLADGRGSRSLAHTPDSVIAFKLSSIRRIHYRIIFKEVCKTIHSETSLPVIFEALAQVAAVLRVMHPAGWVHRDVSTGNILLANDGTARLCDLEYACTIDEGGGSRVGTDKYMAVEISEQHHWFLSLPLPLQVRNECSSPSADTLSQPDITTDTPAFKHHDLRYNPLHDLESLWWVAVYFIFMREAIFTETASPKTHDSSSSIGQRQSADKLFETKSERILSMTNDTAFMDLAITLDMPIRKATGALEIMRQEFVEYYRETEANLDTVEYSRCADDLHQFFIDGFHEIATTTDLRAIHLRPFTPLAYDNPGPAPYVPSNPFPSIDVLQLEREILAAGSLSGDEEDHAH